jgi:hypothetical protein
LKSCFLDIDDNEMENVNKRGWRVRMHAKLWVKNVFDEWRLFCGYDKENSIEDVFENKDFIKDFIDMLCFFYFASCKERWQLISSNQVQVFLHLTCFSSFCFYKEVYMLGFRFLLHHSNFLLLLLCFYFVFL